MSPRKCSAKQLEALRKGREKRKKNLDASGKGKTCKGKKGSCKTKGSYDISLFSKKIEPAISLIGKKLSVAKNC